MSRRRRPLAALALIAMVALISACGSSAPAGRHGGGGNNTATNDQKAVKFAECMRGNGVSEFPDPGASGKFTIDGIVNGSSLDPSTPAFKQAISACKDLEPAGFTGSKRSPQQQEAALKFAQCMRENGVPDFPDPTPNGPLIDTIESHPPQGGVLGAFRGSTPRRTSAPLSTQASWGCGASDAEGLAAGRSGRPQRSCLHALTRHHQLPRPRLLRRSRGVAEIGKIDTNSAQFAQAGRPANGSSPGDSPTAGEQDDTMSVVCSSPGAGQGGGTLTPLAAKGLSDAEWCFLAYAAHELRGSITLQRTLAEVALADPDADTTALRGMAEKVAVACQRQERLLEALLALARSEHGHLRLEPVDLAATAAEVLRTCAPDELMGTTTLEVARTTGDPQLIERLFADLVANAVRHNVARGRIDVATYTAAGRPIFTIANTGPRVPTDELNRLFQPFQRLGSHAGPAADGVGLGLAIVRAIADSHGATITTQALTGGGLKIDIAFPPDPSALGAAAVPVPLTGLRVMKSGMRGAPVRTRSIALTRLRRRSLATRVSCRTLSPVVASCRRPKVSGQWVDPEPPS